MRTRAIIAVFALATASPLAAQPPPEWLTDQDGVLELKLAHHDKSRPDGGILRVDRNRRLVTWEGIPGDIGCKLKLEATFEDVEAVKVGQEAGFTLELKKGKPKKLVLIPVHHVEWLLKQQRVQEGIATTMAHSGALTGPGDEQMTASGAAAGAGPSLKKVELPAPVVQDTKRAANAVLSALGRPTASN